MTRRRWVFAGLALAGLAVLAAPAVQWRLIGWARGEPFYRDRPASWWASQYRAVEEYGFDGGCFAPSRYRVPVEPLATLQRLSGRPQTYWEVSRDEVLFAGGDPAARPVLAALLADADAVVRERALAALGWRDDGQAFVPELVALLADPDPSVRAQAAVRLGWLGPAARPAVPALRRMLVGRRPQQDYSVDQVDVSRAWWALEQIDPAAWREAAGE